MWRGLKFEGFSVTHFRGTSIPTPFCFFDKKVFNEISALNALLETEVRSKKSCFGRKIYFPFSRKKLSSTVFHNKQHGLSKKVISHTASGMTQAPGLIGLGTTSRRKNLSILNCPYRFTLIMSKYCAARSLPMS